METRNVATANRMSLLDAEKDAKQKADKSTIAGIYALQAASVLLLVPILLAAVMGYAKEEEVKGTWLESHVRWQIRTFWPAMVLGLAGMFFAFCFVGYVLLLADAVWIGYRVSRGWMRLAANRNMYL